MAARRGARAGGSGWLLLGAAWLVLLAVVGGGLSYAFLTYDPLTPAPSVTSPLRFEEAPVPAPRLPLSEQGRRQEPPGEKPAVAEGTSAPSTVRPPAPPEAETDGKADDTMTRALSGEPAAAPPNRSTEAGTGRRSSDEEAATTETGATDRAETSPEQLAAVPRPDAAPPKAPVSAAWQRFAMPFDGPQNVPHIAVVITGLGLHDNLTRQAIEELPAGVTLSFSPYARGVETWLAQARAHGHEVMLDLPMEPQSYPNSDPGHFALFVSNSSDQNLSRLEEVLARGSAYVGVAGVMGSRFTATPEALRPVLKALGERGLIFLDNRQSDASVGAQLARQLDVPTLYSDRSLDGEFVQANAIASRLAQVERLARTKGVAVAMAGVYPTTFRELQEWAEGLAEKGLALAPVTELIGRQPPAE